MNLAKLDRAVRWATRQEAVYLPGPLHTHAILALGPWLDETGARSLLDCGCGKLPSVLSEMCEARGIQYRGIDLLGEGRVQGDVHNLGWPDRSFDMVVSREGPEHYLIPALALMEMARVSRRWLIVAVPSDAPRCGMSPGHISLLSREGWETLFRRLTLHVVRYEALDVTEDAARPQAEWRWLLTRPEVLPW